MKIGSVWIIIAVISAVALVEILLTLKYGFNYSKSAYYHNEEEKANDDSEFFQKAELTVRSNGQQKEVIVKFSDDTDENVESKFGIGA